MKQSLITYIEGNVVRRRTTLTIPAAAPEPEALATVAEIMAPVAAIERPIAASVAASGILCTYDKHGTERKSGWKGLKKHRAEKTVLSRNGSAVIASIPCTTRSTTLVKQEGFFCG